MNKILHNYFKHSTLYFDWIFHTLNNLEYPHLTFPYPVVDTRIQVKVKCSRYRSSCGPEGE